MARRGLLPACGQRSAVLFLREWHKDKQLHVEWSYFLLQTWHVCTNIGLYWSSNKYLLVQVFVCSGCFATVDSCIVYSLRNTTTFYIDFFEWGSFVNESFYCLSSIFVCNVRSDQNRLREVFADFIQNESYSARLLMLLAAGPLPQ
jgi:hypothetical protein